MYITIKNCKIFFEVYGSKLKILPDQVVEKPTLIVLHGGHGMVDHTIYVEFWSQLSDIAQVVFMDQRGCGRSDARNPSEWNLHQWAEDVFEFCNILHLYKPIIAGISMGGHVMGDLVRYHPDLAGGLIFCNTEARFVLDDVCEAMAKKGGAGLAELTRKQFFDPTPLVSKRYQEECVPYYARNAYSPKEVGRCRKHMQVFTHFGKNEAMQFNYLEDLAKICCPTLLIAGEESPLHPPIRAIEMLEKIPKQWGYMHIFKNAGAPVYKDAPEEASQVVREFILTHYINPD